MNWKKQPKEFDFSSNFGLKKNKRVYINCPFCVSKRLDKPLSEREDTQQHLLLDSNRNFYYCFRCSARGKLEDLKEKIFLKPDLEELDFEHLKRRLNSLKNKIEFKGMKIEDVGNEIKEFSPCYNYLSKRSINEDLIKHYGLLEGKEEYFGRVVVPEYNLEKNRIRYFTARSISENVQPKYLNPPLSKTSVVFNLNQVETDWTILTEGCFSAIAAGKSGIAVFGKKISMEQYANIALKFKRVYVCFDPDVSVEDKNKVRDQFLLHGCESGVMLNLKGDPNEVTNEEFLDSFHKTEIYNPEDYTKLLLKKIFC